MSQTFVLLHGAWHGGWCWARVADALRARGHRVTTPTQTGLGERRHLMGPGITLHTFIDDLVNHVLAEDLTGVTLVGHSFGGNAVSGAAEAIPERLGSLIYLDSTIIGPGERPVDVLARPGLGDIVAEAVARGEASIPPPDPSAFGVDDPDDRAWVARGLTPHPVGTMTSPMPLKGPPGADLPVRYIACTAPRYHAPERLEGYARTYGWTIDEIATGHDAMVTAPAALAEMLAS